MGITTANRGIIEFGRRKIGLPVKPVIKNKTIDLRKEKSPVIYFADEHVEINGYILPRQIGYLLDPVCAEKGDMIVVEWS